MHSGDDDGGDDDDDDGGRGDLIGVSSIVAVNHPDREGGPDGISVLSTNTHDDGLDLVDRPTQLICNVDHDDDNTSKQNSW